MQLHHHCSVSNAVFHFLSTDTHGDAAGSSHTLMERSVGSSWGTQYVGPLQSTDLVAEAQRGQLWEDIYKQQKERVKCVETSPNTDHCLHLYYSTFYPPYFLLRVNKGFVKFGKVNRFSAATKWLFLSLQPQNNSNSKLSF